MILFEDLGFCSWEVPDVLLRAPGGVHRSTHSAFGWGGMREQSEGGVVGTVHFTIQTLVLIPAPFQLSPSPIPAGSQVQCCHKSWRTNVMEKLGMQLLGSAGFKVKHEFIPLESILFSKTR